MSTQPWVKFLEQLGICLGALIVVALAAVLLGHRGERRRLEDLSRQAESKRLEKR